MSNKLEQIEILKNVFNRAKSAPRDTEGAFEDLDFHGEVQDALSDVGKQYIEELKDEVVPYLDDVLWEFRDAAVTALCGCNGLQLEEYKDRAYEIWQKDVNQFVRATALNAWARYYLDSKDPFVLKILYNVFSSEEYIPWIRVIALCGFMDVADGFSYPGERSDIYDLNELEDNKLVTKAIDWNKVYRIMKQYVPGWKRQ